MIERAVMDNILSCAQMLHPREATLLLKGKVDKHRIMVNDMRVHRSWFNALFPNSVYRQIEAFYGQKGR